MLGWDGPIDLRDHHVRRMFAQELVVELRKVGAATIPEMREGNVCLLRIPAEADELEQVTEVSRRLGWVEAADPDARVSDRSAEWRVSQPGLAVPPPESLGLGQVVTRLVRVADPVRQRAADWLPLAALLVGAVAAQQAKSGDQDATLNAVRALSIGVLLYALVRGGIGEIYLVRAMRAFKRLNEDGFYRPAKVFQSRGRLAAVAVFDLLVLLAFGLAIFLVWTWALAAAAAAVLVGIPEWLHWRMPASRVWDKRPPRPGSDAPG